MKRSHLAVIIPVVALVGVLFLPISVPLRLVVVQTGAKPQQLDLMSTEAAALQNEIATLNDRLNRFTMTTPIPGTVVRSFGPDTLLQVLDIRPSS